MAELSQAQQQQLRDIVQSMRETEHGRRWPMEYTDFFRLWRFFNRIYEVLYTEREEEWRRIARFALDKRFSDVWDVLDMNVVQELARQPCVGNGRKSYEPSENVRIAFEALRRKFEIDVQGVCQSEKCQQRKNQGWELCSERGWENWPQKIRDDKPEDAKYTLLGATLTILYQIRNNLFHGSKLEIHDPQRERNRQLVEISARIIERLLIQVIEHVQRFP
jgi:hypothetical protein